jgi:hypothetical protein
MGFIPMRSALFSYCLAAAVVACSAPSQPVNAEEAPAHVFRKDQLRCVIDHLAKYESSPNDPVIIFLEICPDLTATPARLAKITKFELPTIAGTPDRQGKPERHLSIKKAELKCLLQYRPLVEGSDDSVVRIPATLCSPQ